MNFKRYITKLKIAYCFSWMIVGLLFLTHNGIAKETSLTSQWRVYQNSRFHYQICYPPFMIPQGEAENGDGQIFLAKDGATIRVYGSNSLNILYHNDFEKMILEVSHSVLGDAGRITYRTSHSRWAIVSGYDKDGNIVYMKLLKGTDGQAMVALLTYSETLESRYNSLSVKIATCFKAIE
ncbi:hypothetical protein [Commensalibacter nepenthis]|uniref:Uncharacterized protein n=1 Tax=Commensalibacter nepenthis TaxID=3043872 RepID=A0ABT6Q556_9PROT|nr:hypothetical protein [Commensalibacter sp. TBRC 10068]MDI2112031.1 hypothetical protein [Commensalibacter sp. TBRC 10068]